MGEVLGSKEIEKLLKKNGFILMRSTGSHFQYFKEGKGIIPVPRHNKDMAKGTVNSILKKSGLK